MPLFGEKKKDPKEQVIINAKHNYKNIHAINADYFWARLLGAGMEALAKIRTEEDG